MTKAHDENLSAFEQLPPTGGMGEEQIAELERLMALATPGTWDHHQQPYDLQGGAGINDSFFANDEVVMLLASGRREDFQFIAALVNAAPALLAAAKGEAHTSERDVALAYWARPENRAEAERLGFAPPSHPDRREQYARIIDPNAWAMFDESRDSEPAQAWLGTTETWRALRALGREPSFSKADQILALPVPGGWKLVPVEPTEETVKAVEFAIYRYADCSARDAERAAPHVYAAVLFPAPPSAGDKL